MDDVCRFCAMLCTTLENIFVKRERQDAEPHIMILEFWKYEISESDLLPQNICGPCMSAARNAFEFKSTCEQSEAHFKQLLSNCEQYKIKCELDEVCRFCTINCETLDKIFPEQESMAKEPPLITVLEYCSNCEIRELDSLPQQICGHCRSAANHAYQFKLKCEQNQTYFRELLSEVEQKPNIDELTTGDWGITECKLDEVSVKQEQDSSSFMESSYTDETDEENCGVSVKQEDSSDFQESLFTDETDEENYSANDDAFVSKLKRKTKSNFVCCICPKTFANALHLRRHKERIHEPKVHDCPNCSKSFSRLKYLNMHIICHTEERPFKCDDCPKTFKTVHEMKRHSVVHSSERPHKCSQCTKAYKTKQELKNHLPLHSDERPFKCDICSMAYKIKSSLRVHSLVHTDESPFKCEDCPKRYKTSLKLKNHRLSHSEERLNKCEHCAKSFKSKSALTKHMLIHSEDRPFICEHCKKSFKAITLLNSHLKTHSDNRPFKCEQCAKTFKLKDLLRRHYKSHSDERPHKCEQCAKAFKKKSALKRHIATHPDKTMSNDM